MPKKEYRNISVLKQLCDVAEKAMGKQFPNITSFVTYCVRKEVDVRIPLREQLEAEYLDEEIQAALKDIENDE